jgi:hypothetical protein
MRITGHLWKKLSPTRRLVIGVGVSAAVLASAGGIVYAALSATATGSTAISSGEVSLTMSATSPSTGFPQTLTKMAPGDSLSLLVKLANGGTLATSGGVTLSANVATHTLLDTSATYGLQVALSSCSVAWSGFTLGVHAAPTCSGTLSSVLTSTPLATIISTPAALSNVTSLLTPGGSLPNLLFTITLPTHSETTTNGVLPSGSIQGLSDSVTWTFTATQRGGQNTNA